MNQFFEDYEPSNKNGKHFPQGLSCFQYYSSNSNGSGTVIFNSVSSSKTFADIRLFSQIKKKIKFYKLQIKKNKYQNSKHIPAFVSQVQRASKFTGNSSKKKYLYPSQPDPRVYLIQGEIIESMLGDVSCKSSIGSFFNVNHAFVVFVFSTVQWVRTEIAGFKDGQPHILHQSKHLDIKIMLFLDAKNKAQEQKELSIGQLYIQQCNCYDFATFILQDYFECGDVYAKWWKQRQLNKVWNFLKD